MLNDFMNENPSNWDKLLHMINTAYNSQEHKSTVYTLFEMVYGKKMQTPLNTFTAKKNIATHLRCWEFVAYVVNNGRFPIGSTHGREVEGLTTIIPRQAVKQAGPSGLQPVQGNHSPQRRNNERPARKKREPARLKYTRKRI
ncbi:hypothetical protein J6590_040201 [Homalodisca vitripennis]|nr:hypothetical protein J6590_040201 [Homalodisca vitripennis]